MLTLLIVGATLHARAGDHAVHMDIRNLIPVVQVMVNGRGPFTFSIDTGTGGEALISPDLVRTLGLTSLGDTNVGDSSGMNTTKSPVFRLKSIKVAGVEFTNIKVAVHQPTSREQGCDGILGFTLFRDYLFSLDYADHQLVLSSGSLRPDGGNTVLPFTMPDNIPLIELRIGDNRIGAQLDSGGMGLDVPREFARGLQFTSEPVVIAHGHTVSNDFEIEGAVLASDVQLGSYTIAHPFVEINPVFHVANFGAIPLQHFAVTFDQKNNLVQFVAASRTVVVEPPRIITPHAEHESMPGHSAAQ
jgi:hypothetical protein